MYSLLTLLGVCMGLGLLQGIRLEEEKGRKGERVHGWGWLLYIGSATAALYTHYFAIFLLLAFVLYLFLLLYARSALRNIPATRSPFSPSPLLLYSSTPLLLYLPWLYIMLTQLSTDASYWQGALKLWEALRHVLISFTSGETVLEQQAVWLLVGYGLVTLVALVGLVRKSTTQQWLLLGLWLFVPVAGVLGLALFVPKFNPRYVMMGLPGLILVWSIGLSPLGQEGKAWSHTPAGVRQRRGEGVLVGISVGLLAAGFLFANGNWYWDRAFTKDQWREAARFVVGHMAEDEAVLLVSGHAWPVWRYYAPTTPAIRAPDLEILDVESVLDYGSSAATLRQELAGKQGVWLIGWQDEVVDPMAVAPLHFARAGQENATNRQFWGLSVRHFSQLKVDEISPNVPNALDSPLSFANQIDLLGQAVTDSGTLLLFWRLHPGVAALDADLQLVGEVETAGGVPYASLSDRRPTGYDFPTFRWRPGQITVSQIRAAEWLGPNALPGAYQLRLGLYAAGGDPAGLDLLDGAGAPRGKRALLNLEVSHLPPPSVAPPLVALSPQVSAIATVDEATVEAGQPVDVSVTWQLAQALTRDASLEVHWVDHQGRELSYESMPLWPAFPSSQWPVERPLRTVHRLRAPAQAEPAQVELTLALSTEPQEMLRLPITISPSTRQFVPPPLAQRVDAEWAGQIQMLGLQEPLPAVTKAGQPVELHTVWQALAAPAADYTVTAQFLDADGQPQSQVDLPLPGGSMGWTHGQVIEQLLPLHAPEAPGDYQLIAALYNADAPGQPRLVMESSQDFVLLGEIAVEE